MNRDTDDPGFPTLRRKRSPRVAAILVTLLPVAAPGGVAQAQTYGQAAGSALVNSYTLRAEEARAEGAEARLRGSLDQFMPTAAILVDKPLKSRITYSPQPLPTTIGYGVDDVPRSAASRYGIGVDLPLFDGFKRWNDLQSSRQLSEAGRLLVDGTRQQVLLDTAVAFVAVLRDARISALRRDQVAANERIMRSTEQQLTVGDATRTDVALARSRVQDARTGVQRADADLAATRIEFTRLTRLDPDKLSAPAIPDALPASEEAFVRRVRQANPKLAAARLGASSAGYQARSATAALSPQVSLQFSHFSQFGYSPGLDRISDTTTRILARIPIYEPGTLPRINEASALARQRESEVQDAELQVVASARAAFRRRRTSAVAIDSARARVAALRESVRGMEIERGGGFRTVLDELNLRAELAQAEVVLTALRSEHDVLVLNLAAIANLLGGRTVTSGATRTKLAADKPPARPAQAKAKAPGIRTYAAIDRVAVARRSGPAETSPPLRATLAHAGPGAGAARAPDVWNSWTLR